MSTGSQVLTTGWLLWKLLYIRGRSEEERATSRTLSSQIETVSISEGGRRRLSYPNVVVVELKETGKVLRFSSSCTELSVS